MKKIYSKKYIVENYRSCILSPRIGPGRLQVRWVPDGPEDGCQEVWSHPCGLDNGCQKDVYVTPLWVIRRPGCMSPLVGNWVTWTFRCISRH